jgi:hypothetical protein
MYVLSEARRVITNTNESFFSFALQDGTGKAKDRGTWPALNPQVTGDGLGLISLKEHPPRITATRA